MQDENRISSPSGEEDHEVYVLLFVEFLFAVVNTVVDRVMASMVLIGSVSGLG